MGESYKMSYNKYCSDWYCYYGENEHICFVVPVSMSINEIFAEMGTPKTEQKIVVTYYPITKIMHSVAEDEGNIH